MYYGVKGKITSTRYVYQVDVLNYFSKTYTFYIDT